MKILTNKKKEELLKQIHTLVLCAHELIIANDMHKTLTVESSLYARKEIIKAAYEAVVILGGIFEAQVMKNMFFKNCDRLQKQFRDEKQEEGGTDD